MLNGTKKIVSKKPPRFHHLETPGPFDVEEVAAVNAFLTVGFSHVSKNPPSGKH
jgi:hypothetical protein